MTKTETRTGEMSCIRKKFIDVPSEGRRKRRNEFTVDSTLERSEGVYFIGVGTGAAETRRDWTNLKTDREYTLYVNEQINI